MLLYSNIATLPILLTLPTFIAAQSLYQVFVQERKIPVQIKNPFAHYAAYTLFLPLLASLVPAITLSYQASAPDPQIYCNIEIITQSTQTSKAFYKAFFDSVFLDFVPWLMLLLFTLYVLARGVLKFRSDQGAYLRLKQQTHNKTFFFILFPSFVLTSRFFVQLRRIILFFDDRHALYALDAIGYPLIILQGLLDSLIFHFLFQHYKYRFYYSGKSQTSSLLKSVDDDFPLDLQNSKDLTASQNTKDSKFITNSDFDQNPSLHEI